MADRPVSGKIPSHAKRVFEGVLFDVYHWEQELFDGTTDTFECMRRNDGANVIPILPNGNILIAEDEQPGRDMVITFPGGCGEGGEDIEEIARRELLEETGYEAEELILWRSSQPSSKIEWMVNTYIGRGCRKVAEPELDPGERIRLREITFDELLTLADDPRFQQRELIIDLIKARYDEKARESLRKTLFG